MRFYCTLLFLISLAGPVWAHGIVLNDDSGNAIVVLRLKPEWTVVASRDGIEMTSPDDRTRIHCLELRSSVDMKEGRVFLSTLRDTLYQTYEETATEPTELDGVPAVLFKGRGMSRGFECYLEALLFRDRDGRVCLVMLQQDVGHESGITDLKSMLTLP